MKQLVPICHLALSYLAIGTLTISTAAAATCGDLAKSPLKGGEITRTEAVDGGELTLLGRPVRGLPKFCRVAGTLRPSADSEIKFEVWLPATWNGKFHGIGNGGFAGEIGYAGLVDAVKNGYATASTDTGHEPKSDTNASWALNHPEKVVDFGYRAIHETAVAAKTLVQSFYGRTPAKSYFNSCSNGGRQALMEAQRFPEDYDGIIAGAPANDWTSLLSVAGMTLREMLAVQGAYFGPEKLPAIQAAALAQCDAKDGVTDGVIENPLACRFDTSVLRCRGEETNSCLTARQLKALDVNYAPVRGRRGEITFPGMAMGGEAERGGWASWITGTAPEVGSSRFGFATNFFKYIVYGDPEWSYKTFDLDRDMAAAVEKAGRILNATETDMSNFQKRGGKLLLYHGWSDAAIPGAATVKYYDAVVATMGAAVADSFVRLYMAPGVGHCGGGSGPSNFGQAGTPNGADRFHSIDAALEAWVEQGQTPEPIIASRPDGRTRPLCPWPQVAKYSGKGSTDDASNFSCAKP